MSTQMTEYQIYAKMKLDENDKTFLIRLHEYMDDMRCVKENRPYLTGVGNAENTAILLRPDCKCWNCPKCAARNAKRWIARIINHVNTKPDATWQMFTLTAHENWRGERSSVENLRQGWKRLYNRIRDKFGCDDYCKVWERHTDGTLHLHGLICDEIGEGTYWLEDNPPHRIMTKRWLKNSARSCGMGYQVDLHKVDNAGQVAGYIAKYFMKSEAVGAMPKDLRRIEVSRGWTKLPDLVADNQFSWIINATRDGQIRTAQQYFERGFDITDYVKGEEK